MARIAERADVWAAAFSDPKRLLEFERSRANFGEGLKHLLLGAAAFSILYATTFTLLPGMPSAARPFDMAKILIFTAANTLIASAAVAVISALNYAAARAFGGKGTFEQHFYLNAIVTAPALVLYYVAKLFPGIGVLLSLGVMAFFIFMSLAAIRIVHRISGAKAFAALFIPSVLVLLLLAVAGVTASAAAA